jgi:hypothetical protein
MSDPVYRAETEMVEITLGPDPSGRGRWDPDPYRKFMPGMTHYYKDDEEITKEEFMEWLSEQQRKEHDK